jgi:hypothetical protein
LAEPVILYETKSLVGRSDQCAKAALALINSFENGFHKHAGIFIAQLSGSVLQRVDIVRLKLAAEQSLGDFIDQDEPRGCGLNLFLFEIACELINDFVGDDV